MVPSAPASAAPLSPPVDSERAATEPWDRRVAARDPSVLQAARAGQLEIDQHSYVLNACFKHQAWDWVEQLWPPSQPELNQPAFTDQWVLDAMSAGGPQRAMALYHQADVTKNLGHLLSLAVMRSEPELWETLTSLKEWSDDQGEQAAIQLARWGTDHPRHRTLARTWFLRLAKALPDASRRAHLVRTALLARGMERCAWPIFRSLPPEDQRQAAIEIYPHVESQGLPAWPARCWKARGSRRS